MRVLFTDTDGAFNLVLMPTALPCFCVSSMKDVSFPPVHHIDWSIASDACSTRHRPAYALSCTEASEPSNFLCSSYSHATSLRL